MKQEILDLRKQMSLDGVNAYYVPSGDYHNSEYFSEHFRVCSWLSGFSGEAADMVVTEDGAWLWTDGRFFLQAEMELEGSGIELMRAEEEGVPTVTEFLKARAQEYENNHEDGYVIGFDGKVVPMKFGRSLEKALEDGTSAVLKMDDDAAGSIWKDRPPFRTGSVWRFPVTSAGVTAAEKLRDTRNEMRRAGADYLLLTDLMESAWLLNLRGSDIAYTPVFYSYVLVGQDSLRIYLPDAAVSEGVPDPFDGEVPYEIRSYDDVYGDIRELEAGKTIMLDPATTNCSIWRMVPGETKIIEGLTPVALAKIIKNDTEIRCEQNAHIKDAAAVIRTIRWVRETVKKREIRETDVSDHIREERLSQDGCFDLSFESITGYGPNAAIIHYAPQRGRDAVLKPEGFLLLDSGGQYIDGTTDITRTIALGPLTEEMIRDYTLVLKGHIAFSMFRFGPDMDGTEADEESRKALREAGLDFNHGVSHGVGHVLAVHEGPRPVGRKPSEVRMAPGMIISNEPGVYLEGRFGIRIENMVYSKEADDGSGMIVTEPLTLVPYERDAIDPALLTEEELAWVNGYHQRIRETVGGLLSGADREFLEEITEPVIKAYI